jgi:hypothetical protein
MNILTLAHVDSHLLLDGKEYEIDRFNVVFSQAVDHRGQPQHETKGGKLHLRLTQIPDNNLYEWAKTSTKLKGGLVVFNTETANAAMRVEFSNARCILLEREIQETEGTCTKLIISPEILITNGVKLDNHWAK